MQLKMDIGVKNKYSKNEILLLSKNELCKHLEDITQTDICKDANYCKSLIERLLSSLESF